MDAHRTVDMQPGEKRTADAMIAYKSCARTHARTYARTIIGCSAGVHKSTAFAGHVRRASYNNLAKG